MIKMLVAGDTCPIGKAHDLFATAQVDRLFTDLLPVMRTADLMSINLECAFSTGKGKPIKKDGPALGVSPACINGFIAAGINVVNLANNHCMDFGDEGLNAVIEGCKKANIDCLGAGKNVAMASEILIKEINGIRVGFLGMAEHEFSIAGVNSWGANPLDLIAFTRKIRTERMQFDFLIVFIHGGKEYYPYPTPKLQDICRFLVEMGAGAVICQHSHCPGCYEIYQDAPIIYGQGNFVFDKQNARNESWYQGFLVELEIDETIKCKMKLLPYLQFFREPCVKLMLGEEKQHFMAEIERRSQEIKTACFVRDNWQAYCRQHKYTYFSRLHGHNRLWRVLNRIIHFSDWCPSSKKMMMRNVVECETHREVLETLWRENED